LMVVYCTKIGSLKTTATDKFHELKDSQSRAQSRAQSGFTMAAV